MKRLLLAGAVFAVLTAAVPARAQVATIDSAEITQTVNTLHQLEQEYTAVMGVFGALLRQFDPNSIAPGMIGQQPLPGAADISQAMTGVGQLSGLATQFQQANTVYMPTSTGPNDFNAAFLQRNSNSLAGIQAMLQTSIGATQTHITALAQIGSALSALKTVADLAGINGRLLEQQANLTAQQGEATTLQTMLLAQQAQFQLQQAQMQRQSADALLASVTGTATGGTAMPQITAANLPTFTAGP